MTPNEFLSEASSFAPGSFVVVSGNDQPMIGVLLSGAQAVIESGGLMTLLYDSRATEWRQVPEYQSCNAKFTEDGCDPTYYQVGIPWESKVLLASGSMVTLVGNFFDTTSPWTNPWGFGLPADVVIDLLEWHNVRTILESGSKKYAGVRDLYPFVTKVYWYDGPSDQITYVKDQVAELPHNENLPVLSFVQPPIGPTVGRQIVTLKGENFYPGAKVSFDGMVATDVVVVNENVISCQTPVHPLGASNVELSTQFGLSVLGSGFYFVSS